VWLTAEELCVCEQFHEMCCVTWLDVVALQMERDVAECRRVAVDVEGSYAAGVVCGVVVRR
jgi:hypothetical protein